ncbi:hypothetical protein K227x_58900 [Rubripirellula lacrimiformis]|uniref:Uncharacterized protein n=2 Tax=Rubripirellula lacrimiformis TaxID=1930273 RepID=A0A517NKA0_9BACT|nr:hypothetical protein K227x_58900 [Rubripirellula lacrimiformis]
MLTYLSVAAYFSTGNRSAAEVGTDANSEQARDSRERVEQFDQEIAALKASGGELVAKKFQLEAERDELLDKRVESAKRGEKIRIKMTRAEKLVEDGLSVNSLLKPGLYLFREQRVGFPEEIEALIKRFDETENKPAVDSYLNEVQVSKERLFFDAKYNSRFPVSEPEWVAIKRGLKKPLLYATGQDNVIEINQSDGTLELLCPGAGPIGRISIEKSGTLSLDLVKVGAATIGISENETSGQFEGLTWHRKQFGSDVAFSNGRIPQEVEIQLLEFFDENCLAIKLHTRYQKPEDSSRTYVQSDFWKVYPLGLSSSSQAGSDVTNIPKTRRMDFSQFKNPSMLKSLLLKDFDIVLRSPAKSLAYLNGFTACFNDPKILQYVEPVVVDDLRSMQDPTIHEGLARRFVKESNLMGDSQQIALGQVRSLLQGLSQIDNANSASELSRIFGRQNRTESKFEDVKYEGAADAFVISRAYSEHPAEVSKVIDGLKSLARGEDGNRGAMIAAELKELQRESTAWSTVDPSTLEVMREGVRDFHRLMSQCGQLVIRYQYKSDSFDNGSKDISALLAEIRQRFTIENFADCPSEYKNFVFAVRAWAERSEKSFYSLVKPEVPTGSLIGSLYVDSDSNMVAYHFLKYKEMLAAGENHGVAFEHSSVRFSQYNVPRRKLKFALRDDGMLLEDISFFDAPAIER